jgi:hypothetical protein
MKWIANQAPPLVRPRARRVRTRRVGSFRDIESLTRGSSKTAVSRPFADGRFPKYPRDGNGAILFHQRTGATILLPLDNQPAPVIPAPKEQRLEAAVHAAHSPGQYEKAAGVSRNEPGVCGFTHAGVSSSSPVWPLSRPQASFWPLILRLSVARPNFWDFPGQKNMPWPIVCFTHQRLPKSIKPGGSLNCPLPGGTLDGIPGEANEDRSTFR